MGDATELELRELYREADEVLECAIGWAALPESEAERLEEYVRACRALLHESLREGFRRGLASARKRTV